MKLTGLAGLIAMVMGVTCLIMFQNCGQFQSGSPQSSPQSVSAQSVDTEAIVKSGNAAMFAALENPGADPSQIEQTIAKLQELLRQLQGLPPATQESLQQLIKQVEDAIQQLQTLLSNLGSQDCVFNGTKIPNGSSVTAYSAQTVPSGERCQQESRTCRDGQLSGTYPFATCKISPETANQEMKSLNATYSPNPAYVGNNVTITATGGVPPYSYKVLSGAGSLNGNVYKAPPTAETAAIEVKDSNGGIFNISLTVSPQTALNVQRFIPPPLPYDTSKWAELLVTCQTPFRTCWVPFTFTVPNYSTLTVRLWGGGGVSLNAPRGGDSTFLNLVAGGGDRGAPGVATGGDVNMNGGLPMDGKGGDSPYGGSSGTAPGGGGCGGGGGAFVEKTYRAGDLTPGTVIPMTVGFGGWGKGPPCGFGAAPGEISITWQ